VNTAPDKELRWAATDDCENWRAESLDELLDEMDCDEEVSAGRVVYVGEVRRFDKLRFMPDADHILDLIGEYAYENGGEHGEDYPDVTTAAKESLNHALRQWASAHLPEPMFYEIENVKPYTVTAEDLQP
jgi:hypothetical protein